MPPLDMTRYMTVKDCAYDAQVSQATIRRWMDENRFAWIRKNRRVRLAVKEDFSAFMDSLHNPQLHSTA